MSDGFLVVGSSLGCVDYIIEEAWLEKLEIAHGDLRPVNLLLDHNNTLKICDLDNACRYGQHIEGAHQPYYKRFGQNGFEVAGAASEQFAIGVCAYFIHTGEDPDFTSEGLSATEKFPKIGGVVCRFFDREDSSLMDDLEARDFG